MIQTSRESHSVRTRRRSSRSVLVVLLALAVVAPAAGQPVAAPAAEPELDVQANPKKHRKRQKRPVKMGTSGGNVTDFTISGLFIECCSGTLGGLVKKGEDYFVLSNNHVIARVNNGEAGDDLNQPGFLDSRCNISDRDFVATLSGYKKLKFRGKNKVDAAIGAVVDGSVDESGAVIGIGVPGNNPVKATIGMPVQKSGRTTGVRKGVVDAVNMTVNVQYTEECSSDAPILTARFVKQFFVASNGPDFSAGGDSGSVIFEDVEECPNPVGLLFAGNSQITVGNPMKTVMAAVKKMKPKGAAEFVGCDQSQAASFAAAAALPEMPARELRLAERIQARSEKAIFEVPGVHAMGIGRSSSRPDAPVFRVYLDPGRADRASALPRELGGVPVEVVESEPLRALRCLERLPID